MRYRQRLSARTLCCALLWTCVTRTHAQDSSHAGDSSAKASLQLGAAPSAAVSASEPDSQQYGPPWGSDPGTVEFGLFWGAFIPNSKHELYEADRRTVTFQELERVTPELGLRAAYVPLRVLGLEIEAALLPSQTRKTSDAVNLWAVRGHLILQAPTKTFVPFLLAGGGLLGISSDNDVLGSDFDTTAHGGVGVKAFVTSDLALRLDVRDNITQGLGKDKLTQHWEALLGLSIVYGRPLPPPPPPDSDGDGILDPQDQCPQLAGVPPLGCPPPPPDSDGDGIIDPEDKCPLVAGVASSDPEKNGCPPPPPDGDGDGVPDADDKCPTIPGDGPDGCLLDTDGDGIPNRDDKCPDQPETRNNFEDSDGCPDELPEIVRKYTGVIPGIVFDTGKATIQPISFPTLDAAAQVLVDYPALRVEISGHTDSTGTLERNVPLSGERAGAVKAYLVGKGVADDRVETRGAGPSEPVADNNSKVGRALNRRIEFKLIQPLAAAAPEAAAVPAPAAPAPAPTAPAPAPAAPAPAAPAPAPAAGSGAPPPQ